jgi:hypothetical protein
MLIKQENYNYLHQRGTLIKIKWCIEIIVCTYREPGRYQILARIYDIIGLLEIYGTYENIIYCSFKNALAFSLS